MYTNTIIAILLTIYSTNLNPTQSQSNYSKFIASVCNTSDTYYDSCSCNLANHTSRTDNLKCFNALNCPYNAATNTFCSGNGFCNFSNSSCICDTEYGSSDCSQKYEQFLPNQVILLFMMVMASILLIICVLLVGWVHLYRDVGDVKAMSVVFTHLTLVGCAFICGGTIVMALGFTESNCVILEWFHFFGICIVISCALLKSYRIASIFGQSMTNFSPSDLTDSVLLKYFMIMIIVNFFFLILYTIFNFVEGGAYTRYISDSLHKETRCSSKPLTMVSYSLLVAWQLVLLLFVIKYGNETRSASKIFKETKCIYVGSNIGSMFFIAFGIFVLFTTNYTLQIVIRGYGSLVVVTMVLCLLFYPKFKAVYKKEELEQHDENDKEEALKREYEAHVKDPTGKELLLLLDALVKELAYRADMKMLSIELTSIDLEKCAALLENVKDLIPTEIVEEKEPEKKNESASDLALLDDENKDNFNENGEDDKQEDIAKKRPLNKNQSVQSESCQVGGDNERTDVGLEIDDSVP